MLILFRLRKKCFLVVLSCLIERRPNLDIETKRFLHQRNSFSAMSHMKACPYSYFQWCGYFRDPGYHLLRQTSLQWRSQKLLRGSVFHELTAYVELPFLSLIWLNKMPPLRRNFTNAIFEAFGGISLNANLTWIKLSSHSCSMWDKLGSLNWLW